MRHVCTSKRKPPTGGSLVVFSCLLSILLCHPLSLFCHCYFLFCRNVSRLSSLLFSFSPFSPMTFNGSKSGISLVDMGTPKMVMERQNTRIKKEAARLTSSDSNAALISLSLYIRSPLNSSYHTLSNSTLFILHCSKVSLATRVSGTVTGAHSFQIVWFCSRLFIELRMFANGWPQTDDQQTNSSPDQQTLSVQGTLLTASERRMRGYFCAEFE